MKNFNKLCIAAALSFAAVSCKKGWLDVNDNPNSPTTSPVELVFTNAINVTNGTSNANISSTVVGNTMIGFEMAGYWSGHWAQSSTYITSASLMQYNFTNATWTYWTTYFDNLADYEYVINNNPDGDVTAFKGYAKVMKALVYQRLVDLYGDVPYTEALKGSGNLLPKYDKQEDVYTKLIVLLDEAIADINSVSNLVAPYTESDLIYGGDKSKWIKFANSVKMRILMRQSRIASKAAYITTEVNKVIASGGVLSGGDDATVNPGYVSGTLGKINPFHNAFGFDIVGNTAAGYDRVKINEVLEDYLKSPLDLRIVGIMQPRGTTDGTALNHYIGVPFGINNPTFVSANVSSIGKNQIVKGDQTRPIWLLSAAESQLMMAEAKHLFPAISTSTTAADFYKNGVRLSFVQQGQGLTVDDADDYLSEPEVDFNVVPNKLEAIARQRWTALANFDEFEAWAEQRKSGFPSDAAVKSQASLSVPNAPVRLPYPIIEVSSNGNNVPSGINPFSTKIFWDVN
jgi:hypothetical protein